MNPAFRHIGVLFLTALLLVRSLVVPVILLDFELRRTYISRYLCENRNRPELHCNGKCYLAKKLKAARETEEREAQERLYNQLLECADTISLPAFEFSASITPAAKKASFFYSLFFPSGFSSGLFRPPRS